MTAADRDQFSMLAILNSICNQALQTFKAADNPVDQSLVEAVEQVEERTRRAMDSIIHLANPS